MKKRILSLLLVIAMVVGMLPASVFAADATASTEITATADALIRMRADATAITAVEGKIGPWLKSDNYYLSATLQPGDGPYYFRTNDAGYVIDGTEDDHTIEINYLGNAAKLILKGAAIANDHAGYPALILGENKNNGVGAETAAGNQADYEIIVEGDSTIDQTNDSTGCAILNSSVGTLTITSVNDAKLAVKGKTTGTKGVIHNVGSLVLKDANLYVGGYSAKIWYAIYAQKDIDIIGGNVQAWASNKLGVTVYAAGDLTVDKAKLTAYSAEGVAVKADGADGVTFKDSYVKLGNYSGTSVFAAPPTFTGYADGYTVKTDTAAVSSSSASTCPTNDTVSFNFTSNSATASNTFDAASATTYKVFEIAPANKGSGTINLPDGTSQTSYGMAMGDDTKYFDVVDGIPVQITEQANFKNYKLKIEYPVAGMLTVTLNGAQLTKKGMYGIGIVTAANCPVKVVTEADSTVIASADSSGAKGRAFDLSGAGDVIFTSVNDATLKVAAKVTGSDGYIGGASTGDVIFENANMKFTGIPKATHGSGGSANAVYSKGDVIVKGGNFTFRNEGTEGATEGAGVIAAQNIYFENTNVWIGLSIKIKYDTNYISAQATSNPTIQIKNSTFKAGISRDHGDDAPGLFNVAPTLVYDGCVNAKGTRDIGTCDEPMTNPVTLASGDANAINYRHVEIIPADSHTLSGEFETDENYHWGVCTFCGIEIEKEAHTEGPAQKENVVDATETEAGSYNLVTRCLTCNKIMSSVPVTVPAVRKARVVFFTGAGTNADGVDRFILTVQNDGEALYYWTVNGALATTNADGLEANEENGYNVKFVYNPNDTAAKLYLRKADLSVSGNQPLLYIGHPSYSGKIMDFSLEIVLEGENTLTKATTQTNAIISINQTEGNTLAITGNGSLSIHSKVSSSDGGIITSPVDLTIGKDATVNLYHTAASLANDIVMNGGADLVVDGTLNIRNASAYGYNATHPEYKQNPIITNGGGNVYINEGAKVSIVSRQSTHAFDVSGKVYVDAATLTVAMNGGYLFKYSDVVLTNVDKYVSLDAASVPGTNDPTQLEGIWNVPATEEYAAENVTLYKYAAITPHNHAAESEWDFDEDYHWHNCNGTCDENCTYEKAAHEFGDPAMENIVEATTRAEGSYDWVKRCKVCNHPIVIEHVVTPKIKQAYIWFFYGVSDHKVPVAVSEGGTPRYLYTTSAGKIQKDAEGNVVEATDADYNIKLEYPEGAEKATLTLRNAKLVNDANCYVIQLGYQNNCTNFSLDIVLEGENHITSNGATNYYGAIGHVLDDDQTVTISGNGVLNAFATTSSGSSGVISAPDLTIAAGATVNAYNIGDAHAICVSATSGDLVVNGVLGAYTHNSRPYSETLENGTVIYKPTIKAAGDIEINKDAVVTVRSKQKSYVFDAGGTVSITEATVDALIGAVSGSTSPANTYVFKEAPVLSGALDAQGTDSLKIAIGEDYKIVEEPALQRFDQFEANVLNYRYVKITPHQHVYEDRVSTQKADDANCQHGDLYYVQCRNCDQVSDTVTVETTAPLAHNWADATCTSGKICSDCKAVYTYGNDPFYMVNLANMGGEDSDSFSHTYQMINFRGNADNVVEYQGESDVIEIAKNVKATLATYPRGARYIYLDLLPRVFKKTYENGIYMDEGVKIVQTWMEDFLKAYSSIGGQVDGFIIDLEFEYGRPGDLKKIYAGTHANEALWNDEIFQDIYNDPRFVSTGMKAMMEERGVTFGNSDLSIILNNTAAYQAYDEAFNILMNSYVDQAMKPLAKYYPDAHLSDYDKGYSEAWQNNGFAGDTVEGTANRVGNSSNMSIYFTDPSYLTFDDGKMPDGYNKEIFEDTAFNAAKWNIERFKQMLAATPVEEDGTKNVSVWITEYNYSWKYDNATHYAYLNNSPYYAEAILHLGLSNPSPFIGYVKPPVITDPETGENVNDIATYNKYLAAVNSLMVELSKVAGTDDRTPIELPYSWNDGYILSGMNAGGRNIWRITPNVEEANIYEFMIEGEETPTFYVGGQKIVFPQGRIVTTDNTIDYEPGTYGFWVETPEGVNPVVISDENRYSAANGFIGAENKAELTVYNELGDVVTGANTGFTAYRVEWMNVDNIYKYLYVKNNGVVIREVLMAPGQDSFIVGEIADGTNLLTVETVAATDYVAEDPYASDDFFWADATKPNHEYKYVSIDENNHKYVCDCGAVAIESEPHEFDENGNCICGAVENVRMDLTIKFTGKTLMPKDIIYVQTIVALVDSANNDVQLDANFIKENLKFLFWSEESLANNPVSDYLYETAQHISEVVNTGTYAGLSEYYGKSMGIPARSYGDVLYMRACIEIDGEMYYSDLVEYSVREYCTRQIDKYKSSTNKYTKLCATMLNYGSAAQIQFNYKTDALVCSYLQDYVDKGYVDAKYLDLDWEGSMVWDDAMAPRVSEPAADMTVNFAENNAAITSRTLSLSGAIDVVFTAGYALVGNKATQIPEGAVTTIYFWSQDQYNALASAGTPLDRNNATYTRSSNVEGEIVAKNYDKTYGYEYQFKADPVSARFMDETIYLAAVIELPDGSEAWSKVYTYSPMEYVARQLAKTLPTTEPNRTKQINLNRLCKWMAAYKDEAKNALGTSK